MELLSTCSGSFRLQRLPLRNKETLRAWDAADEYLLSHFAEQGLSGTDLLLVNDDFGALGVALAAHNPVSWSDSWLAHSALRHNLALNQQPDDSVHCLPSTAQPTAVPGTVLMKLPKNTCLLEQQLITLRQLVAEGTTLVAGDMAKHIHSSTLALFEKHFGPTKTSLAKKKARLIFATVDKHLPEQPWSFPKQLHHNGMVLVNHAGVFSRQKLDIGTRFFLEHLPTDIGSRQVIDLGCGNGALGVSMAQANPECRLHFIDESYMAVASAQDSWLASGLDKRACFSANDCLTGCPADSADYVLCNPPFHQGNTVGDHIAWRMFQQSLKALRPGGELRIIGNRHLGYHIKLKKLFGNCRTVASNSKFVVLSARKR